MLGWRPTKFRRELNLQILSVSPLFCTYLSYNLTIRTPDDIVAEWPWWKDLHAFWRELPHYNPIGVENSMPGEDHSGAAAALFEKEESPDEEEEDVDDEEDVDAEDVLAVSSDKSSTIMSIKSSSVSRLAKYCPTSSREARRTA